MLVSSILVAATLLAIRALADTTTTTAGFPDSADNDGAGVGFPAAWDRLAVLYSLTHSLIAEATDTAVAAAQTL
ncbi:hypothetical protein NMY22_g12381 [Coprinellus aureogranulatus]|nr:hypothetical protein NMY22_g12381 [Coprinellus aureogranulatus]